MGASPKARSFPLPARLLLGLAASALLSLLGLIALLSLTAGPASALSPSSVVVVANPDFAGSVEVAEYYLEAREIPQGNLLSVAGPTAEIINRTQYDEYEAAVEAALETAELTDTVEVLVLVYGVPLKINSDNTMNYNGPQASVDSELALLVSGMQSGNDGRHNNPYFNARESFLRSENDDMLLVARLDGHDKDEAMGLVDEALSAEANNTQGWAHFDRDTGMGGNYAYYDEMIVEAFNISLERGLDSALEESAKDIGDDGAVWSDRSSDGVEPANGTVTPFFYWGWYSDSAYHDTFHWTQGAVGMRLHSFNARSMRDSTWVTGAVADNITGSTGHVWEPWLDAATYPHYVMEAFYDGYTAAEAFWMGTPYLSWQNIVVGDPLYRPVILDYILELDSIPPTEAIYPGDALTLELTLTNHGSLNQDFVMDSEGLPYGLNVTLDPVRVRLNGSGGMANITLTLELDIDPRLVQAGDYTFNVTARPDGGPHTDSMVSIDLTVAPAAGIRLEPWTYGSAVPNDTAFLELYLYNYGNTDDNFTLGIHLPDEAQKSSAVWLAKGHQWNESGVAYLEVGMEFRGYVRLAFEITLPFDMSLWAGTILNLTVEATSGVDPNVTAQTALLLEVGAYYGLDIAVPPDLQEFIAGSSTVLNFTLNNTGNAPYNVTVSAFDQGISWLEGSDSQTLLLTPQETLDITLSPVILADAPAGLQNLSWDLTWEGDPVTGETLVIVRKPDLKLEGVELFSYGYSREPRDGDPLKLKGWIRANEVPFVGNPTLTLEGLGYQRLHFDIGADELPFRFTHNFTLSAGAVNLTLTLDAPAGVFEQTMTNNIAYVNLSVLPLPDLRVATFTILSDVAGSGRARANLTLSSVPWEWTEEVDGFTLKPSVGVLLILDGEVIQTFYMTGPTHSISYNLTDVEGTHNLTVILDPEGKWPEIDELNNEVFQEFSVAAGSKDDGTSNLPLPLLLGAVFVIGAAVVALYFRKEKAGTPGPADPAPEPADPTDYEETVEPTVKDNIEPVTDAPARDREPTKKGPF